jgi:hypothetical protein
MDWGSSFGRRTPLSLSVVIGAISRLVVRLVSGKLFASGVECHFLLYTRISMYTPFFSPTTIRSDFRHLDRRRSSVSREQFGRKLIRFTRAHSAHGSPHPFRPRLHYTNKLYNTHGQTYNLLGPGLGTNGLVVQLVRSVEYTPQQAADQTGKSTTCCSTCSCSGVWVLTSILLRPHAWCL